MPAKRNDPETVAFTITLPKKAAESIEILVNSGFYGGSRAEAAKIIILQHLQEQWKAGKLPG
ncbi:MAG: hypothetical protein R3C52_07295 [Hyphomonadaceae bacterium]